MRAALRKLREHVRVRPVFAWYDIWAGVFIDRTKRRVYWFPVPMLGVRFEWREKK